MCNPYECINANRDRGDNVDDWVEGPCGENPGKLLAEVKRLRMRAKGIEAFLKLLDERMELAGLGEFWKTHYTDKERLDLAEGSISFAVSSVKFNKRWDDNMQRTKRNE